MASGPLSRIDGHLFIARGISYTSCRSHRDIYGSCQSCRVVGVWPAFLRNWNMCRPEGAQRTNWFFPYVTNPSQSSSLPLRPIIALRSQDGSILAILAQAVQNEGTLSSRHDGNPDQWETAIIFPGPSRVGSDPKWDRRSAFNVICRPRSRGGPTRPPTR